MTLAALIGPVWGPTIDAVQVDVSISEMHSLEAEITDVPVETGSNISDHRRVQPRRLSIQGVLSDFPASQKNARIRRTGDENFEVVSGQDSGRPTAEARFKDLIRLAESPDPFVVVTGLDVYEDMSFTKFDVERSSSTGVGVIRFSGELRKIIFADSIEVQVKIVANKVDAPKVKPKTNVGPKATTAPKTSVEKPRSTLDRLLGGEGGAKSLKGLLGG